MASIVIFIPHFGPWPVWIDFFVESCKRNSDIDWVLPSDSGPLPRNNAKNIKVIPFTFSDYCRLVSDALQIHFSPNAPYKLCDIRPAIAEIHPELVSGYNFFGYGDMDVIYGHIRDFYTKEILSTYSVLSTHPERLSGHLTLLRNSSLIRNAFRHISSWKLLMQEKDYVALDEKPFLIALNAIKHSLFGRFYGLQFLLEERYSSPGPTEEMRWYWQDGRLTNEFYGARGFLYLHFMHWKSSRWYSTRRNVAPTTSAPWDRLKDIVQLDWQRGAAEGFMISPNGIQEISYKVFGGNNG